jgi:hypothetical protein
LPTSGRRSVAKACSTEPCFPKSCRGAPAARPSRGATGRRFEQPGGPIPRKPLGQLDGGRAYLIELAMGYRPVLYGRPPAPARTTSRSAAESHAAGQRQLASRHPATSRCRSFVGVPLVATAMVLKKIFKDSAASLKVSRRRRR